MVNDEEMVSQVCPAVPTSQGFRVEESSKTGDIVHRRGVERNRGMTRAFGTSAAPRSAPRTDEAETVPEQPQRWDAFIDDYQFWG
jgi:hypothetical protein